MMLENLFMVFLYSGVILVILTVGAFIADEILPRIPAVARWLEKKPNFLDAEDMWNDDLWRD